MGPPAAAARNRQAQIRKERGEAPGFPGRAGNRANATTQTLLVWLRDRVVREPRWWKVLFWVNFLGALYGFWWYRDQLIATPARLWLVVPDSPAATLLFAAFLGALLAGAVPEAGTAGPRPAPGAVPGTRAPVRLVGWVGLLGALAFLTNMKYGMWTAIVLPQHGFWSGRWSFDHVHLTLSHLGMWLQGFLFLRRFRPGPAAALAAWAWVFFQDYVDYWPWHTHSTLPAEELHGSVAWIALSLSAVWGGLLVWLTVRRDA